MSVVLSYMGNRVPRVYRPISTTTSVRVDVELFAAARRRGMNLSSILNSALKALLTAKEPDLTDEQVAALVKERDKRIENVATTFSKENDEAREGDLRSLQSDWNMYIAAELEQRPTSMKLAWIGERKKRYSGIAKLSDAELLTELEGKQPA